MVTTRLIVALSEESFEKALNKFLEENQITQDRLVDVKLSFDTFYRALVIYVK